MVAIIADPILEKRLIAQRQASGADKYDEVWEGVYVMSPMANSEHQDIVGELIGILWLAVQRAGLGRVHPGANVSSRATKWKQDYRCPDVLVFLQGNPAKKCKNHWFGGPDLAIEVISKGDRSYEKMPFYASVNTREVLLVDRDPWALVMFRNQAGTMVEVGRSNREANSRLSSSVVPLSFQLIYDAAGTPQIDVRHQDGQQQWLIKTGLPL